MGADETAAISVLSGAAAFLAVPGEQLFLLLGMALLGALCKVARCRAQRRDVPWWCYLGKGELSERDDDSHVGEGGERRVCWPFVSAWLVGQDAA